MPRSTSRTFERWRSAPSRTFSSSSIPSNWSRTEVAIMVIDSVEFVRLEEAPPAFAPATRLAAVDADGTFVAAVPDAAQRSGPIALRAIRPDGLVAGSAELPAGTRGGDTALKVALGTPTKVETSGDPALGAQL